MATRLKESEFVVKKIIIIIIIIIIKKFLRCRETLTRGGKKELPVTVLDASVVGA